LRYVELRRHSLIGPDKNLSEEGRELARKAAGAMLRRDFSLVLSSPRPRCIQTAEAMGFPNVEVDERFGTLPGERPKPFEPEVGKMMEQRGLSLLQAYLEHPGTRKIVEEHGRAVLEAILEVAGRLPEGGAALVISHGGTIEPAALLAMGAGLDLSRLGGELAPCEGVGFSIEEGKVTGVSVHRLVG